jgi:hypothetical protein
MTQHTINAPSNPSLDVAVRVIRTRNSVYVFNVDGETSRVTCVFGTFAGQSFTYDPFASDLPRMGAPIILRGVKGTDVCGDTLRTTEVVDYAHA